MIKLEQGVALTEEDLIKALGGGRLGKKTEPKNLDELVARMRQINELLANPVTLTPGQIIRHRYPDVSSMRDAEMPHIFVRYLGDKYDIAEQLLSGGMTVEQITNANANHILDCVIGTFVGDTYMEYIMDSRMFEPHPDYQ